ncbi:unnamed protein product [Didymodactylos carnosus]|uniref:EFR3-like protein n=1 Tax=Didymodactylos carnosus TaxID=1234261 RepID=A0A813PXM9_9BILA|nr:unnamed protein product [Didymodactylos carnosus]CAF0755208.1 unnamed protein product [Didymodactylos carnosus]CAF3523144.1 unnamed protein product [Didymodactylos carnosus]CAF3535477.1 unnamed protein product [Didymodactylos carnosus]
MILGLDKSNLESLTFYAVRKPEKLDKSVRYMAEKVERYLSHSNRQYVILGVKAMTEIMKSCCEQLNSFVDHYLAALRLVLEERNDLELTEQAVLSFESFCKIPEEAPSYQRNYDFFFDRFTELCHNNNDKTRTKFRCLGLRGHHALILKTANDELQTDVWKHMDKIVPSIIYNMDVKNFRPEDNLSQNRTTDQIELVDNDDPSILAENVLKDLFDRAHLNNIKACVQPILIHLDNHMKWIPVDFPKYIFSKIMRTIKHHNGYLVIELLLAHLETHLERQETADIKSSIMNVIQDCMIFTAESTGAGSTMFTGIQRLLNFLKKSFEIEREHGSHAISEEQKFQTAIINGIGDFTQKLPDFQMIEVMQFIITSLPNFDQERHETPDSSFCENFDGIFCGPRKVRKRASPTLESTTQLASSQSRIFLLQVMQNHVLYLLVAATYHLTHRLETSIQTTFPRQLFDPLLKMMNSTEPEVRLNVIEILQSFVDRRNYSNKIRRIRLIRNISQLELPTETKSYRLFDLSFMKKFGPQFLSQLYKCILYENNNVDLFHAIYCLINLITLEAENKDVFVDFIHFCLEVQSTVIKISETSSTTQGRRLSTFNQNCIHALIAAYFNLISKLNDITQFYNYVDEVVRAREHRAPYLLPPMAFNYNDTTKSLSSLYYRLSIIQ